jgi:hypothetical protein
MLIVHYHIEVSAIVYTKSTVQNTMQCILDSPSLETEEAVKDFTTCLLTLSENIVNNNVERLEVMRSRRVSQQRQKTSNQMSSSS